jgi:hypothetical protein
MVAVIYFLLGDLSEKVNLLAPVPQNRDLEEVLAERVWLKHLSLPFTLHTSSLAA